MGNLFSWIRRNISILINWLYKNRKWLFSGIGVAILTVVFTFISQYRYEQSQYPIATEERLNYLVGDWRGEFIQEDDKGKPGAIELTVTFINKGRIINGRAQFVSFQGRPTELRLFNGVFDGTILKIEYENKEAYIFQKGSVVAEMIPHADVINGKFVGYSPEYKKVVSGEVTVSKVKIK